MPIVKVIFEAELSLEPGCDTTVGDVVDKAIQKIGLHMLDCNTTTFGSFGQLTQAAAITVGETSCQVDDRGSLQSLTKLVVSCDQTELESESDM
jgi:hypothetical protein